MRRQAPVPSCIAHPSRSLRCIPNSAPTTVRSLFTYSDGHLRDGAILATRAIYHSKLWPHIMVRGQWAVAVLNKLTCCCW